MMQFLRSGRNPVIAILLAALISACGFQLRGQHKLPAGMEKVFIQGESSGLLLRHLKQSLQRSGATVTGIIDNATAVITLYRETTNRSVLSVASNARVREYQSRYNLIYSVRLKTGKVLIEKNTISLRRDFSFNEVDVLGKEREETTLQHDMQYQAAQTILRRLVYQK